MKDSEVPWIGEIPFTWEDYRLRDALKKQAKRQNSSIPAGAISFGSVVLKDDELLSKETKATYQEVKVGDFLINPINLNYDLKSLRTALSTVNVCVSPAYIVATAKRNFDISFLKHLLHLFDLFHMKTLGAGVRQTITFDDIGKCRIFLPPFDEQRRIADFLDLQTSLIDRRLSLIANKKEALLRLQKTLISEAVVRGLQPSLPMKDSGVPWLGLIPSHWSIERCKNLFRISKNVVGDKAKEFTLLSLTKQGIIARDMENPQGKFPAEFDTYQIVKPGEFVFCLFDVEETPRTVELSSLYGMITGAYTVMKSLRPASSRYLYYQFLSFDNDKKLRPLYTGMRNTIPKEVFMGIVVALPPPDEQAAIVEMIDRETAIIKKQLELLSRQEILLAEQRKALIHEAITGKIDLSAYATDKSMLEAAPAA